MEAEGNQRLSHLTLAAMRTFNATLSPVALWLVAFVPPVIFFLLVQRVDNLIVRGELGTGGLVFLIALAQLLPLGALAYVLFSTAAYTIAPGKLTVHRVISDREFSLEKPAEPPRLRNGVITVVAPLRRLRIRVDEPETCFETLRDALDKSPHPLVSK